MLKNNLNIPTAESITPDELRLNYVFNGDEPFALRPEFLKSYSQRELDYEKRIFNYRLSRTRIVIENAFGILANRFKIFHTTINLQLHNIDKYNFAGCVLHNFLRRNCSSVYTPTQVFDVEDTVNGTILHDGLRTEENTLLDLQKGSYNRN